MKIISKLLIVLAAMVLTISVNAQSNTGLNPFAGSTHDYHVDQSSLSNTTLTWSVTGADAGDYEFVGGNTGEDVSVKWNTAKTYTLIVEETRTDLVALAGCPTTRNITVIVSGNTFDIYAELVGDATRCAEVSNPVDDDGVLGSNSDDVFGLTTRVFKVKMANGDANKTWKFNYALNDVVGVDKIDLVGVVVTGQASLSGTNTVNMAKSTTEATITVTYNTNKNSAGDRGQDPDFNLALTIDQGSDELGTPDSNEAAASNIATYIVKAVPATTGITTN